jgi:hypothetical protein
VTRELVVDRACHEVVAILQGALRAAGFRVEQSFDLRSALAGAPTCACPHHGTARCDCQYNVLLVYGQTGVPVSLIVHGHDARTWIVLAGYSDAAAELAAQITQAVAGLFRNSVILSPNQGPA